MKRKLKIAWICHFSNMEVQEKLPLWKGFNEFASWIPNMIEGFESREDIELHIVAPHIYLKCDTNFVLRGVHYHFLSFGFPIINRPWPSFFALDAKSGYSYLTSKIVKKVVQINPDIVNLQGAENAYYSSSILRLKYRFPCVITIQGFASHMHEKRSQINKTRINVEEKILKNFKYFYLDDEAVKVVRGYSPQMVGKVVWWPAAETIIDEISEISYSDKKYDILFCGRMEKSKGIEDFIKVVSLLKKKIPDIKACIIGSCIPEYGEHLKKLALKLNSLDNIHFVGFVQTQHEMFSYFKNSKLLLVPTLIDRYPSTIREAMRLNLPVLAYRTGSIPWTNRNEENIVLVEHGNSSQMAVEVEALLQNKDRQQKLIKSGRRFYENEFSRTKNVDRFITGYYEVINEFKKR